MLPAIKVKTTLPVIDVKSDVMIFKQGGEDKRMFLILDGNVKLYTEHEDGTEVEVAVIHKYQFFGEIEMFSNRPRTTSAKVLTDAKLVIIRTATELEKFASDNSWLSGKMMTTMGERLAVANNLLANKLGSATIQSPAFQVETSRQIHGEEVTTAKVVRH